MTINITVLGPDGTDILQQILSGIGEIQKGQTQIMASIANVLAADAALKNDLTAQSGLITQLIQALSAAAAGTVTQVQLQTLLTDLQDDDTTVQSATTAIQAALNPIAPAPAATPVS